MLPVQKIPPEVTGDAKGATARISALEAECVTYRFR
jgi:hypothetical protein